MAKIRQALINKIKYLRRKKLGLFQERKDINIQLSKKGFEAAA